MIKQYFFELVSSGSLLIIVAIVSWRLKKPNVIYGFPYESFFTIEKKAEFLINTIYISNNGLKTVEEVCIFFDEKPDHFMITPPIEFKEVTRKGEQYMIKIPFLSPKSNLMLQLFSYKKIPGFKGIRVKDGIAKQQFLKPQPVYSNKLQYFAIILLLLGVGSVIYLGLQLFAEVLNLDFRNLFFK